MPGPLDGVRIIDFSQVVAGPFAATFLADQGADIIKVEPVTGAGDMTRGLPSYVKNGFPALMINNNRGKRCIALDLTTEEGRSIGLELCEGADVVLQNFRPGAMGRLGLDYDSVAAVNPKIIYCSISGFGPDGPYSDRPVLDPVIQGLTGIVDRQVNPDIPFPDLVRNLIADKSSAYTAAQAITAALFVRERTGEGQNIEVPMLDSTMYFFWPDGMMDHTMLDEDVSPGFLLASVYRLTDCADGKIVYFVANDPMRIGLFDALGHPEWGEDPRFSSMAAVSQGDNFEQLGAMVAEAFSQLTVEHALARLMESQVPCGPILTPEQAFEDPQVIHNETVKIWEHPKAGKVRSARPGARFSKTPAALAEQAGARGEHTEEILLELGRNAEQIAALEAEGHVGTADG